MPLDGPLKGAAIVLLWFRVDEAPIEATSHWNDSAGLVARALAIALHGLSKDQHLVVTGFDGRANYRIETDPPVNDLVPFLRTAFTWDFRAYVGPQATANRVPASGTLKAFVRDRANDLGRWSIVADECYDAGALEIWSKKLTAEQLAAKIDLAAVNVALARVQLGPS